MVGPEVKATISGGVSNQTIKQISVVDPRLFKEHEVKQIEDWSWKKLKHKSWFIQLDCKTGRFKIWKPRK